MIFNPIDEKILTIIHTHRNGEPVGIPTIDRILLNSEEEFILNGLLGKKLDELENKNLIHSPNGQIGYSLTDKGLEYLNSLSNS